MMSSVVPFLAILVGIPIGIVVQSLRKRPTSDYRCACTHVVGTHERIEKTDELGITTIRYGNCGSGRHVRVNNADTWFNCACKTYVGEAPPDNTITRYG